MNSTKNGLGLSPLPLDSSTEEEKWLASDPSDLIEPLDAMPIEMAASWMLTWYRSGDLWKVTLSSHYFAQNHYQSWINGMIGELQCDIDWRASSVLDQLAKYGEPAVERILRLLGDASLRPAVIEIVARMDLHSLPRVLRALRRESRGTRLSLIRSYALRKPDAAYGVMVQLLYGAGTNGRYWNDPMDPLPSLPSEGHRGATNNRNSIPLQVVPLAGGFQ